MKVYECVCFWVKGRFVKKYNRVEFKVQAQDERDAHRVAIEEMRLRYPRKASVCAWVREC